MLNRFAFFLYLIGGLPSLVIAQMPALRASRDSTARVVATDINSSGSGSFLSDTLVLTCMHVVFRGQSQNGIVSGDVSHAVQVVTPAGEMIPADVVSIPSENDASPLENDFAFIRLRQHPRQSPAHLAFGSSVDQPGLGDDVFFSGYPLATPGMVSHKGMVSGANAQLSLIFIEAPINKGNSGGGLVNSRGKLIGIVSLREGGITQGLAELRGQISQTRQFGSVKIMGMDPLQSTEMLIDTVDQYISTGIGYARDVKYAREYMAKHADLSR